MKVTTSIHRKHMLSTSPCLLFLLCTWSYQAMGQSAQTQPNQSSQLSSTQLSSTQLNSTQLRPPSLPQLYWAFLSYQNHLDTLAAQREAQGQDASWIRNGLQTRLGFSDADYAPIRTSAKRLTSEIAVLSRQVKQIRAAGSSTSSSAQAQALTALTKQRQTYVANEIYNLTEALSPQNKATFEKFITQFFAPKKIAFRAPNSTGLATGGAVQK